MHCILGGVGHLLEMHEFPLSVSFLKMQPVENAGVRSMRSSPVIVCLFVFPRLGPHCVDGLCEMN